MMLPIPPIVTKQQEVGRGGFRRVDNKESTTRSSEDSSASRKKSTNPFKFIWRIVLQVFAGLDSILAIAWLVLILMMSLKLETYPSAECLHNEDQEGRYLKPTLTEKVACSFSGMGNVTDRSPPKCLCDLATVLWINWLSVTVRIFSSIANHAVLVLFIVSSRYVPYTKMALISFWIYLTIVFLIDQTETVYLFRIFLVSEYLMLDAFTIWLLTGSYFIRVVFLANAVIILMLEYRSYPSVSIVSNKY